MAMSSISFRHVCSSFHAPTKLVPQYKRSCIAGPCNARNLLNALMKHEVSIDSITSIWMALVDKQVKRTAQRLLLATSPLVRRVLTSQGPKTSRPTKLNGGAGVRRSMGRSAIFCVCCRPLSFLHLMQLFMALFTARLPPTIQNPLLLIRPSVKCRP